MKKLNLVLALALALSPLTAFADLSEDESAQIVNIFKGKNPGFERGKAGHTASGGTFLITSSSPITGGFSATFDASAGSQTVTGTQVAVPEGLKGKSCMVAAQYIGGDANLSFQAVDGSLTVLGTVVIGPATVATSAYVTFPCPSSGTVAYRWRSSADAAVVKYDKLFAGSVLGLTDVSQAKLAVDSYFPSNALCQWDRTTITAMGDFSTDTDCVAPVVTQSSVGTWLTTDADLPQWTATNLPPGHYRATYQLVGYQDGTAANSMNFQLTDDTTAIKYESLKVIAGGEYRAVTATGVFTYTAPQASVTFKLQGQFSNGTQISINGESPSLRLVVEYFPLASEQAMRFDTVAQSWSGYHTTTCEFGRSSASYGDFTDDASCSLTQRSNTNMGSVVTVGSTGPGIVFSPGSAGKYKVCAKGNFGSNTIGDTVSLRLVDGSANVLAGGASMTGPGAQYASPFSLCADLVVSSIASQTVKLQGLNTGGNFIQINPNNGNTESAIEWTIEKMDQQIPAPVLVGGLVTPNAGTMNLVSVLFAGNAGGTVTCSSDPCNIVRQSGGVTSVNRSGTGLYVVNFSAGTFSAAPICTVTLDANLNIGSAFNNNTAETSTSMGIATLDNTGATVDGAASVMCLGPK